MSRREAQIGLEFVDIKFAAQFLDYPDNFARREAIARYGCRDFPEFAEQIRERIRMLDPEIEDTIVRYKEQREVLADIKAKAKKANKANKAK
jgi:hypothetical protein